MKKFRCTQSVRNEDMQKILATKEQLLKQWRRAKGTNLDINTRR